MRTVIGLFLCLTLRGGVLFSPIIDESQFRVTTFISGLPLPLSMLQVSDGSLLVQTSPGFSNGELLRFTSVGTTGIASTPGTVVFSNTSGPLTQLEQAGQYVLQGNAAVIGSNGFISILAPGATPSSPFSEIGRLQFTFNRDWDHPTMGIALRPTPGLLGSFDVVFNVGSEFDHQHSATQASVSGLGLGTQPLDGESLYMVTLDLTGPAPIASNLRQVARGIRNVFGMEFDPTTGDQ